MIERILPYTGPQGGNPGIVPPWLGGGTKPAPTDPRHGNPGIVPPWLQVTDPGLVPPTLGDDVPRIMGPTVYDPSQPAASSDPTDALKAAALAQR